MNQEPRKDALRITTAIHPHIKRHLKKVMGGAQSKGVSTTGEPDDMESTILQTPVEDPTTLQGIQKEIEYLKSLPTEVAMLILQEALSMQRLLDDTKPYTIQRTANNVWKRIMHAVNWTQPYLVRIRYNALLLLQTFAALSTSPHLKSILLSAHFRKEMYRQWYQNPLWIRDPDMAVVPTEWKHDIVPPAPTTDRELDRDWYKTLIYDALVAFHLYRYARAVHVLYAIPTWGIKTIVGRSSVFEEYNRVKYLRGRNTPMLFLVPALSISKIRKRYGMKWYKVPEADAVQWESAEIDVIRRPARPAMNLRHISGWSTKIYTKPMMWYQGFGYYPKLLSDYVADDTKPWMVPKRTGAGDLFQEDSLIVLLETDTWMTLFSDQFKDSTFLLTLLGHPPETGTETTIGGWSWPGIQVLDRARYSAGVVDTKVEPRLYGYGRPKVMEGWHKLWTLVPQHRYYDMLDRAFRRCSMIRLPRFFGAVSSWGRRGYSDTSDRATLSIDTSGRYVSFQNYAVGTDTLGLADVLRRAYTWNNISAPFPAPIDIPIGIMIKDVRFTNKMDAERWFGSQLDVGDIPESSKLNLHNVFYPAGQSSRGPCKPKDATEALKPAMEPGRMVVWVSQSHVSYSAKIPPLNVELPPQATVTVPTPEGMEPVTEVCIHSLPQLVLKQQGEAEAQGDEDEDDNDDEEGESEKPTYMFRYRY